jgi:hypothetical protein
MPRVPLDVQLKNRLTRISELQATIEKANSELLKLTGLSAMNDEKNSSSSSMPNTSPTTDIKSVFSGNPDRSFSPKEMTEEIKMKFGHEYPSKKILGALDNLATAGFLVKEGKGRGNVKFSQKN